MSAPCVLTVRSAPDGAVRVAVGGLGRRSVEALVPMRVFAPIAEAVAALIRPQARVLVRGRDAVTAEAEARAGQQLARLIAEDRAVGAAFAALAGEAQGRGGPLVLVVDAVANLAALPWELLALAPDGPGIEASGAGAVARLVGGRPSPLAGGGLRRVLRWVPWPDDPICARRAAEVGALAERLGVPLVDLDPARTPTCGEGDLLHLITHGTRVGAQVRLLTAQGERAAAEVGAVLGQPPPPRAVLEVCHGAAATPAELDALSGQLLAAGVGACVAPADQLGVLAGAAFAEGLYAGLAEGRSLMEAVTAGRRRVRALADPRPAMRWHRVQLRLADLAPLEQGGAAGWRPQGWPRPGPEAAALLVRARAIAEARGHGFVGLEHLTAALEETPGGGPVTAHVRVKLGGVAERLMARVSRLDLNPEGAVDWGGTPRLRALGAGLLPGFEPDALWAAVAGDPNHALHGLASGPLLLPVDTLETARSTLMEGAPRAAGGAVGVPDAYEVIGGPEDGRVLTPPAGEPLGRWWPGAREDGALYVGTWLIDRRLSRAHLRHLGPGRALIRRDGERERWGRRAPLPAGAAEVALSDVLILTRATRLRAVLKT